AQRPAGGVRGDRRLRLADRRPDRRGGRMIRRLAVAVAGMLLTAAAAIAATPHPAVDPQVRPGDDFYAYANGPWLKSLPAPQGLGRTDSTSELRVQNARRVAALIETAATAPHRSAATRAIA